MPDEKRIKDFEPATELLIDDWFAVDSPSQGTRKMQASLFQEGLQTQITANTENIALHSGQISVLQQGVGNIGDKVDVLDAAITVEEYSASKLYAVDEDCVYEGVRYKCITAIESPEAFTPSHWQAISIEGELNELNSSLSNLENQVSTAKFGIDVNNKTSFSFSNLNNLNNTGIFKHALVILGTSSTNCTVYLMWINGDNTQVVFNNLTSTTVRTLSGTVSGTTLTITADSTVYGGLKLIWLN